MVVHGARLIALGLALRSCATDSRRQRLRHWVPSEKGQDVQRSHRVAVGTRARQRRTWFDWKLKMRLIAR